MVRKVFRAGPATYRILHQSLRRRSRVLRGGLAWLVVLAVLAALVGNMRYFVDRTAIVTAQTTSLQVQFDEGQYWLIEDGMTLCRPNPDRRAAAQSSDPVCQQFIRDGTYSRLAIDKGDVLEIRIEANRDLLIRFVPCEAAAPGDCTAARSQPGEIRPRSAPNGFVVIAPEALEAAGPLALSGRISMGRQAGSGGGADFLVGGTYEIREQNWLTRMFGRRSAALDRGELIPGAAVEILSGGAPSTSSNGHFFSSLLDDRLILKVVALSGGGRGAVRMWVEGAEPFTIDPDWIDSVIANPVFLALAFLLGILLNALQLANSVLSAPRAPEADPPGSGPPERPA